MMVEHIVLFRWKEDANRESIDDAMEGLKSLRYKIPGIIDISCGLNFSDRAQGYHTGLVVRFQNREALEAYGPHPEHQAVVQNRIAPIRESVLAVDYDIE